MNNRMTVLTLAFLVFGMPVSGAGPRLADNAALQYWKAFASLPDLSDEQEDAVRKALEHGKIDESLEKVIESSESALHELHKGAALEACCWGLSFDEGPHAIMPHLAKARQISRIACLRAEASFQQGRAVDGINDIATVIRLGRHVSKDSVLISLLVDYAIERMAIETVAANLPSLSEQELSVLEEKLGTSPKLPTVADAVKAEKELFVGWLIRVLSKPDGKKQLIDLFSDDPEARGNIGKHSRERLLAAAKELQGFYDELVEAVALPPVETKQAEQRLIANPGVEEPARGLVQALLPAIGAARNVEAAHQTRLALLRAAVAVARDGPDALKKDVHRDPFGTGSFECTKVKGGFTLQSSLKDRQGKSVALTAGRP